MKTKRETHLQQLETAEALPGPTAHPICPTSAPCRTLDLSLPLPMPHPFPTEGRQLGMSQERLYVSCCSGSRQALSSTSSPRASLGPLPQSARPQNVSL